MPGLMKKVRFSRTTTVHHPETPQLTSVSYSPASSAGPLTPPDAYVGLPGPTPYSISVSYGGYTPPMCGSAPPKPMYAPPVHQHVPLLAPAPAPPRYKLHPYLEASRHQNIIYDLLDPPSTASRHRSPLSSSTLAESACTSPVYTLNIEAPGLPWEIQVVAANNRSYVTLGDVLEQLYAALRTNITQREYDTLKASRDGRQKAAVAAYERRYRRYRSQAAYAQEKAGGMKRVDYLAGRTRFMGLSKTKRHDVWVLNTG